MPNLSPQAQTLIEAYKKWWNVKEVRTGQTNIHVDEVAAKVAAFYEKIRGILEWREEHLLRKQAIRRIFKRRIFLAGNEKELAAPLIHELIRGGHFPNDSIDENKIPQMEELIRKYAYIWQNNPPETRQKGRLHDWLLGIASCEIEELLSPPYRQYAMINFMTDFIKERLKITGKQSNIRQISPEELETQIYIAVQRALFKLDEETIAYNLLKTVYSEWRHLPHDQWERMAKNIMGVWISIENVLHHPISDRFYKICQRKNTPFMILDDILSKNPEMAEKKLQAPDEFEKEIRDTYGKRMQKLKATLKRAALYSTISIFFTKIFLALAAEVPLEKYLTGGVNPYTLAINIIFPPLLMFLLIITVRPPAKENLSLLILAMSRILYVSGKKEFFEMRITKSGRSFLEMLVEIFYLLTFIISFGLIIDLLSRLGFSVFSIIVFLMFFSLITFAGVRLRERTKDLKVIERKDGLVIFILSSFSLPFIQVGKWLSGVLSRYNLTIFIDLLIEMPLQVFVEFLEQWRYFLREKREKIH